jgi:hypothetical protein
MQICKNSQCPEAIVSKVKMQLNVIKISRPEGVNGSQSKFLIRTWPIS